MNKKLVSILLSIVMTLALLTACTNTPATGTATPSGTDTTVTGSENDPSLTGDPTKEPTKEPTQAASRDYVYSKQNRELNTASQAFSTKLEAEDAVLEGNLKKATSRKNYSGSGYVTGFNQAKGNKLTLKVNIPYSQSYKLTVRAAADQKKINYLTINGKNVAEINCDGSQSKAFTDYAFSGVYIEAGEIEISISESWGWFDFDSVTIENDTGITSDIYNGIASSLVNPNANEDAIKLMDYLTGIYGNYTLAGQYCQHNTTKEVNAIYELTGKYPAVRGFDLIFCSPNSGYSNMGEINQAKEWAKKGGIVSFSWHWHGPVGAHSFYASNSQGQENTDFRISQARTTEDYSLTSAAELKKLYQEGKLTEKQYRLIADMDAIAFQLKVLQDEGIAILFRPLHEASGGWFWWGASGADDYIWLWKLMFNRMTYYHKLNNLIWVWNGQDAAWYPGDDYVDIVGEDIYADKKDYSSQSSKFTQVVNYSKGNKLTALSENGVIMDPDLCARDNVYWLWFNVWYGDFLFDSQMKPNGTYTEADMIKKAYKSEYVITLDELPWNKK